jgi:hypothetical protein
MYAPIKPNLRETVCDGSRLGQKVSTTVVVDSRHVDQEYPHRMKCTGEHNHQASKKMLRQGLFGDPSHPTASGRTAGDTGGFSWSRVTHP